MPFGFSTTPRAPADLTDSYNTALTPQEEQVFQGWRAQLAANPQTSDLANMGDYDLRGAWKADAQAASNGHLPDTWKKPNHMTFSSGSQYSTPQAPGGEWAQVAPETTQNQNGQWQFNATPANLKAHTADDLLNYFQAVENNARRGPDGRVTGYGVPNRIVLPKGTQ